MEEKYNEFGQKIYPMTPEEEQIYSRLIKEYPEFKPEIEHHLTWKPETRDWADLEDAIKSLL